MRLNNFVQDCRSCSSSCDRSFVCSAKGIAGIRGFYCLADSLSIATREQLQFGKGDLQRLPFVNKKRNSGWNSNGKAHSIGKDRKP